MAGHLASCAAAPPELTPVGSLAAFADGVCDAGHEAFVRRVVPFLWGRKPSSVREVDLLVRVAEQSGRRALLHAMMDTRMFTDRWQQRVFNHFIPLRPAADDACEGTPLLDEASPALAEFVRDHPPQPAAYPETFNRQDLARSVVLLDDMSPWFRAALFSLFRLPNDADNDAEERALRQEALDAFEGAFLHRRIACLGCHNSEYSVTGSADPALDRTWELPWNFETALFGDKTGRPDRDVAAFFRVKGVMAMDPVEGEMGPPWWQIGKHGVAPWGMSGECGKFEAPRDIGADKLGYDGYLVRRTGAATSGWDLERLLASGLEKLRQSGGLPTDTRTIDGETGLAYLTCSRFVERVWEEVTGRELTVPHGFPRNRHQLEVLRTLTDRFVASGYSLKTLLLEVLTFPYVNASLPGACADQRAVYPFAPLFDPWVIDHEVVELRKNGLGDVIQKYPPHVLLGSAAHALMWPPPSAYSPIVEGGDMKELSPESQFLEAIGIPVDTISGFRSSSLGERLAWEEVLGACVDPSTRWLAAGSPPEPRTDFIDALVAAARPADTLEDAIVTLKDRLLNAPELTDPVERTLLEKLIEVSLATPVGQNPAASVAALRRVCGVLLMSPEFLLAGAPPTPRRDAAVPISVPGTTRAELCSVLAEALGGGHFAVCDSEDYLRVQ